MAMFVNIHFVACSQKEFRQIQRFKRPDNVLDNVPGFAMLLRVIVQNIELPGPNRNPASEI
jgi:hypothetical protein